MLVKAQIYPVAPPPRTLPLSGKGWRPHDLSRHQAWLLESATWDLGVAEKVLDRVLINPGWALVRGLGDFPTDYSRLCDRIIQIVESLGELLPQDQNDTLIFKVRDEGYSRTRLASETRVRGASSRASLTLHTDSAPAFRDSTADVVLLVVLRQSHHGGETLLASGETIHNDLRGLVPQLLRVLYTPFFFDRRAGCEEHADPLLYAPVFFCLDEVTVRFADLYIRKGHDLARTPLSYEEQQALLAFQKVAQKPDVLFRLHLQPHDLLFINNRSILHGRTAFRDPERFLLRLWLSLHPRYRQA